MKKRVKSMLLLTAAILGVGAFAAACEETEALHVHTYSEDWTSDAEGHFHQATCDDAEDEAKQAHVDKNNDGACDICEYTDHTHTYSEDWTADCTNHWHAADCGHIVAGADLGAHVDENEDGECDVCKYVIEDIHEHYFDTEWTSGDGYHWHKALCEHKDQISGKEAHNLNDAGDCTVCGEHIVDVDVAKIGDVLAAAQANEYKIIDGAVVATEAVYGGTESALTLDTGKINEVYFVLGNGESYINFKSLDVNGNYLGVEEQWHQKVSDEEYFGVKLGDVNENPERELEPMMSAGHFLNGYNYTPGSIIPGVDVDTSTLANILNALYLQMKAGERVSNASESYNEETGKYNFAYTYYSLNVTTSGGTAIENVQVELFDVNVSFTINEDMIINWSEFEVKSYRNWEYDPDLNVPYEDNGDGTITLTGPITKKATANPTIYKYSVAQHSGVRTFTSPYPRESLIPTDFELYYVAQYHDDEQLGGFDVINEEKVTDSITLRDTEYITYYVFDESVGDYVYVPEGVLVQSSKYVRLHLGDAMPMMSNFSFIDMSDLEFSYVNTTAGATGELWTMTPFYNAITQCIAFYPKHAGTYEMTIKFASITKTFTVVVPGDVGGGDEGGEEGGDVGGDEGNYDYNTVLSVNSSSVWFSAEEIAANTATRTLTITEDGKYKISSNDIWIDSITNGSNEPIVADKQVYELTAGDYTVTFARFAMLSVKANQEYIIPVVKQAEEPTPPPSEEGTDISGTYIAGEGQLVIDSQAGTIVYTFKTNTINYTYEISGNAVTLFDKNGSAISAGMAIYAGKLELDGDGNPATWYYNGYNYSLTKVGGGDVGGGDEGGEGDEATAITDVTIQAGVNNLTLAENTYIEVSAQGFANSYTVTISDSNVIVEIDGTVYANGAIFTSASPMQSHAFKIYTTGYVAVESFVLTFEEYVAPAIEMVLGDNTIATSGQGSDVEFTASEDGTYTFTVGTNGVLVYDYENKFEGEYFELTLVAGQTVEFFVGTEDYSTGDVVITVTKAVGGGDPVDPNPGETEEPAGAIYADDSNSINVTDEDIAKGYVLYTINVLTTGDYKFASNDLYILEVTDNEGNKLTEVEWGIYTLTENVTYVVKINTGNGWITSAGEYLLEVAYQYPLGTQENPIELWSAGDNTAEWNGGYMPIWYYFTPYEDGVLTVSTTDENAVLILKLLNDAESVDGVVSLNVISGLTYYIGVMGATEVEETVSIPFTLTLTAGTYEGKGTENEPTAIVVGDNEVTVEEYGSKFLMYKATENGALVLTAGENCSYSICYPEAMVEFYPEAGVVTLMMEADQVVIVCVGTEDWSAGTVNLNASWNAITAVSEGVVIKEGENTLSIEQYQYLQVIVTGLVGEYTVTWGNEDIILKVDGVVVANGETFYSMNAMWGVEFIVYGANYSAVNVTLTIAKVVAPATPVELGDNTVTVTDMQNGTAVEFTAEEDGEYTFTAGANTVMYYNGQYKLTGESFNVTLEAGQKVEFVVYTESREEGDVVVTIAKYVAPAEPDGSQNNPYIVTELPYELSFDTGFDVYVQYTATEDCTLVITYTGGSIDGLPGAFEKDMSAKTWTGTVTAGQVLKINFYSGIAQSYTISVATPVEPEPEPTPDPEVPQYSTNHTGSGTQADPYVIASLPYQITVENYHDFYIQYTVTEDCKILVTCPTGCLVSGLSNYTNKNADGNYEFMVKAGTVLNMNPWLNGSAAGTYTYTITATPVEPEEPEQGGEVAGDGVVYLGANDSGRLMQVTIDAEAGTMSVIRAASAGNSLDTNFGASEAIYDYSFDGTTVTVTHVSGTGCVFTWNADGTPLTVAWYGQLYTNFTLQA